MTFNPKADHDPVSLMAGILLDVLPIPAGDNRDALLDIANPYRSAITDVVRRADPEERDDIRRHFRPVNTFHVHPDDARNLVGQTLDDTDQNTYTAQHPDTCDRLAHLRDLFDGDEVADEPDDYPATDVPDVDPDQYAAFLAWQAGQTGDTAGTTDTTTTEVK